MKQGRPIKHQDGAVKIGIVLPTKTFAAIEHNPNRSEYINKLIIFDLALNETSHIDEKLAELNDTLFSIDKDRLTLVKEKNALEATKNALTRQQSGALDARLRMVEQFQTATEREITGWFESRTDKLRDCGFADPKEATEWIKNKGGKK